MQGLQAIFRADFPEHSGYAFKCVQRHFKTAVCIAAMKLPSEMHKALTGDFRRILQNTSPKS